MQHRQLINGRRTPAAGLEPPTASTAQGGARASLRTYIDASLRAAGDTAGVDDATALFTSGRLDSLAMTRLVLFLEDEFGLDFGAIDFDVDQMDSIDALVALIDASRAGRS
ncbi:MAG: hypothetical protein RLZZ584_4378 [Pseudomonadota bacterium]|jgi:acyl carrier protein